MVRIVMLNATRMTPVHQDFRGEYISPTRFMPRSSGSARYDGLLDRKGSMSMSADVPSIAMGVPSSSSASYCSSNPCLSIKPACFMHKGCRLPRLQSAQKARLLFMPCRMEAAQCVQSGCAPSELTCLQSSLQRLTSSSSSACSTPCFTIAALISSMPGRKKIMKEAAVPPTMCSTAPRSFTCTTHSAHQLACLGDMQIGADMKLNLNKSCH